VLDILRFESRPDQAVLIDAAWTLIGPKGSRRSGRSVAREKTQSRSNDALAAAHSAALAAISHEIAAAIQNP
jgi:uncharacterized protein